MDVYDSALNKAHQQARKADFYLSKEKYSEAIECHHRAAGYLSELATEKLSSAEAVKSILLQQDYHSRQTAIIQDKLQRFILYSQQESLSTATEDQLQHYNAVLSRAVCGLPYETMDNRHDTMLQYVLTDPRDALETADNDHLVKATRKQKDDKMVIEEQQLTINNLRYHIEELRHEADQLKEKLIEERNKVRLLERLNDQLTAKVAVFEAAQGKEGAGNQVKHVSTLDADVTSIELPPLEVPKFDFELLSAAQDDDINSAV